MGRGRTKTEGEKWEGKGELNRAVASKGTTSCRAQMVISIRMFVCTDGLTNIQTDI